MGGDTMRILETKVYTFDELSDEAKEKALDIFRYREYDWAEDAISTLKQFFKEIGCTLNNFRIDWANHNASYAQYSGTPIDEDIEEYFTGYSLDYPLSEKWNETRNIDECLSYFFKLCNADYDYQNSDERLKELIEINEYEFTEKGELI